MPTDRPRSLSPKAETVRDAEVQMQERLAEYQRKRQQRLKVKAKEEAEREALRKKKREEMEKKFSVEATKARPRRARSYNPSEDKEPQTKGRSRSQVPDETGTKERTAERLRKEAEEAKRKAEERKALRAKKRAEEEAKKKLAEEEAAKKKNDKAATENAIAEAKKKEAAVFAETQKQGEKVQKKATQAKEQAANDRLQQWKEHEAKRKAEAKKNNIAGDTTVERVPKLSALLAMGGPAAEEYKKNVALAKLATWQSNAGDRWEIVRKTWDGRSVSEVTKSEEITNMTVEEAVEHFKTNPEKYLAMHYHPRKPDEFTFILRGASIGYEAQGVRSDGGGQFVIWQHIYKRLQPFDNNILPTSARDKFTDNLEFAGLKLHSDKNKPLLPGRGMGIGDEANMELIGDLPEPSHVRQGACVGDCWLLSAIACLADFDWAVERLFRKNKRRIQELPHDEPNQYTVTLWDLKTWKEVDVVIDERLPVRADDGGPGFLLGAKPSRDGKFWVPYLEKAIAAHCGGYDKLNGGNCTDAWPMLTGSRNQFVISRNPKTKKYRCGAKYNPQTEKWTDHANSPHDHPPNIWQVEWPKVGGGGDLTLELDEDELFRRIVIWDQNNFLLGAATAGTSDKQKTDGIVDNHAYSVIDSRQNICGRGIDLLLIRNPWGEGGELENGQFMRSGSGWSKYPDIKKELNPSMDDNGLFWVTKQEFFKYFPTVYVCALNMTRLKDKSYVNDLKDDFKRKPKVAPKPAPKPVEEEEIRPIIIDYSSDSSSPYKIVEKSFNGGVAFAEINKEVKRGSIAKAVDEFRANPEKYLAIHFQKNMLEQAWPDEAQQYTLIFRKGTEGLEIDEDKNGQRTLLTNVLR